MNSTIIHQEILRLHSVRLSLPKHKALPYKMRMIELMYGAPMRKMLPAPENSDHQQERT